jgi:hypothetical protein
MRKTHLSRAALLGLLLLAACGSSSSLEGSLGDSVALDFTSVSVEISTSAVALLYLKDLPGGGGRDTVLKISANTTGLDLTKVSTIDLTEQVSGQPRGAVSRAVSGDTRHDFAPIIRGRLNFSGTPTDGHTIGGSFDVTFDPGSGALGAGKTAFGNFSAPVTKVSQ